jgi:hypothetical protein
VASLRLQDALMMPSGLYGCPTLRTPAALLRRTGLCHVFNHLLDLGQGGLGMGFAPLRYLAKGFFTALLPHSTHLFGLHSSFFLSLGSFQVVLSSYHLSWPRKKMLHTLGLRAFPF